jgi:DNA end-binding protein Ku
MARVIWKGAISFGLVHVPVALYPASSESGIDFDWLDQRTMDPVGYKRINKRTGKEVASEHIVRGVKVEGGDYVVLGDDEIKAAYPKTTQTIEIESFVDPRQIPFTMLEKPYYLEPLPKGEKVYALLREAMKAAGVVGIARVVMHTKEHLATLVPVGAALMLDTLRWHSEIRPWNDLKLPADGAKAANLKDAELKMAGQLIQDMTEDWQADRYEDRFTQAVQALVDQRAAEGQTEAVQPLEEGGTPAASNVVDLTELLKRSLGGRKAEAPQAKDDARAAKTKTPAKAAPRAAGPTRKPAPRKRA